MESLTQGLSEYSFLGATALDWLITVGITIVIAAALLALRAALARFYSRDHTSERKGIRQLMVRVTLATNRISIAVWSAYFAFHLASMPPGLIAGFGRVALLLVLYQGGRWGVAIVDHMIADYKARWQARGAAVMATLPGLRILFRAVIWIFVVLVALDEIGIDVAALIAGLGVGGLAIALAVQKVAADLLAYLAIIIDEPFGPGDFLIVDGYLGAVEKIGIRSTRIRSLSGEQIIFSNSDLLGSRVRNYGRMHTRRIVFGFGVIYQTPRAKLDAIPEMVKKIIDGEDQARFDRAHFKGYGDSSLDFEAVYIVLSPDYNRYMDIQQRINLALYSTFEAQGIDFAYPTRTLYVHREGETAEAGTGPAPAPVS